MNLSVHINGEGCWPDLAGNYEEAEMTSIALLKVGTLSGKPSVTIRVEMEDGSIVLAQTTLALLATAVDGFRAAVGEEGEAGSDLNINVLTESAFKAGFSLGYDANADIDMVNALWEGWLGVQQG